MNISGLNCSNRREIRALIQMIYFCSLHFLAHKSFQNCCTLTTCQNVRLIYAKRATTVGISATYTFLAFLSIFFLLKINEAVANILKNTWNASDSFLDFLTFTLVLLSSSYLCYFQNPSVFLLLIVDFFILFYFLLP